MRHAIGTVVIVVAAFVLGHGLSTAQDAVPTESAKVELGNFSVSLTVKDIRASRTFYEKLGFKRVHGEIEKRWIILQNGTTTIGLFQGMFPKNTLTFNPGWNHKMQASAAFTDVRVLQAQLEKAGLAFQMRADPATTGPASFMIVDPDGNPILVDQHVPAPGQAK